MPSLTLIPSQAAVDRKLAGFHSGNSLKLSFKAGETASAVLHRFNEYRGPENQIPALFTGQDLKVRFPLQTLLQTDLSLVVG
jgi:hypothetical protein